MKNLKRALSLVLSTAMLLGMMVVGTGAASYKDVDAQDNLAAIEVMKAVGVMEGDENGNFNPDALVTRNEMAVVMTNLLGLKAGGSHPFNDVPDWAAPYVAACYLNGTIAGTSATTFGGSQNVTAAQAALMVMKALGYFGYQGEFGDDWQMATIKQATKIDLFNGMNVFAEEALTRNEVAQLVLNALQADVKVITQIGGLSVEGNGITVNQQPTYDEDDAQDNAGHNYDGGSDDGILQLTEKLFGSDLKKNANSTDDFGRPTTVWTYEDKTINAPKASKVTYTTETKLGAIYADLGLNSSVAAANVKFVIDGDNTEVAFANDGMTALSTLGLVNADQSAKIGAKGTVIEVYYDRDAATDKVVVVMYNYYLAKADEDYNTTDKDLDVTIKDTTWTSAILKAEDFAVVTGVEKDDYLMLTIANGTVKSAVVAELVENAVVSVGRINDYVIADGTKYEYNKNANNDAATLGYALLTGNGYDINGDGYNLYLDPNGYVLGIEGYDAGVNLDNYLFVKDISSNGFEQIAKVMFMDGTTKTVTVDKFNTLDVSASTPNGFIATGGTPAHNKFYTFETDKSGNYELTDVAMMRYNTGVEQYNASSPITAAASPLSRYPSLIGTSTTTFIVKDEVAVGVKNAPEIAASNLVYMLLNDGKLMVVYSTVAGSSKTSVDDLVYILNNNPAKAKDGDDTYYIYDAIVAGEKTTLEANQNSKAAGVYKIATKTDGRADLGTAITDLGVTEALVNYIGTVTTSNTSYKDGTVILGGNAYLVADDVQVFTIDGNTVKTINVSGVNKAVADGFNKATAIEVSSSDSDICLIYLSK